MTKLIVGALVLGLIAGCTPDRTDFDTDEAYLQALQERREANQRIVNASQVIYSVYTTQISAWADQGVDFGVLNPETQQYMRLACTTAVAVSAAIIELRVTDPGIAQDYQAMSAEALKWCNELITTLAEEGDPTT